MDPEDFLPLFIALTPVIQSVLHRISYWRTPANWSHSDWANEERAVVNQSVCQTVNDHTANSKTSLVQAVYFRALARALTRYRQECRYSNRFIPLALVGEFDKTEKESRNRAFPTIFSTENAFTSEEFTNALESLSEQDTLLIRKLFWEEHTQADIAAELHISQRTVSERKQRVLENLRSALRERGAAFAPQADPRGRKYLAKKTFEKMRLEVLKIDSQSNIDSREPDNVIEKDRSVEVNAAALRDETWIPGNLGSKKSQSFRAMWRKI